MTMGILSPLYESTLPHRAKTVYIYLHDRSDPDGKCWPAIRTIGRELGISRSTVKRALHDLDRAGFLRREARFRDNGSKSSNMFYLR